MNSLLEGVNQRAQMVGRNRLELLLFYLNGEQRYGINVFKVQEVIRRPALTRLPSAHPTVCGVATLRGRTIPIFDMAKAIGQKPLADEGGGIVIITEYNRSMQGFLVRSVDRIINLNWEEVVPPPEGTGRDHFLTAVTNVDHQMIELIDVERVLSNVTGTYDQESDQLLRQIAQDKGRGHVVLVVDDSKVASHQVENVLDKMGLKRILLRNGKEAYDQLLKWVEVEDPVLQRLAMIISDIEMPEMDGYTLTNMIRNHDELRELYIILHTSLSGLSALKWNDEVEADAFVPKFDAGDLAREIIKRIDILNEKDRQA